MATILLANLFPPDTAAIAALDFPGSCTFNNGICEAQFSALGGSPTVSATISDTIPNGRRDAMQAGILSVKLRHLRVWTEQRRALAARYGQLLHAIPGLRLPEELPHCKAVYHLYVVRVQDRDALQRALAQAGIDTGVHYPLPVHLQKAYAWLGYASGDLPIAERIAAEVLSLPIYPHLTYAQQDWVVEAL